MSGWMKGVLASTLFKEGLNMAKKIALIVCYGFAVVEMLCWHGIGPGLELWDSHVALRSVGCSVDE
jgi:hypothetical protein